MNGLVRKTFGGLTKEYYIRQFLFGLIFPILMSFMFFSSPKTTFATITILFFLTISTLLYPYARFVYESIVDYIMGDNVFITSIPFMLITKYITMALCWGFSIFIAPVGLLYLYYSHSKEEKAIIGSSKDE